MEPKEIGQLFGIIVGSILLDFFLFWVSLKSFLLLFIQKGSTSLHEAALSKFEGGEKMKILIEYGANVDIQNEVSTNFTTMSVVSERRKRKQDRL